MERIEGRFLRDPATDTARGAALAVEPFLLPARRAALVVEADAKLGVPAQVFSALRDGDVSFQGFPDRLPQRKTVNLPGHAIDLLVAATVPLRDLPRALYRSALNDPGLFACEPRQSRGWRRDDPAPPFLPVPGCDSPPRSSSRFWNLECRTSGRRPSGRSARFGHRGGSTERFRGGAVVCPRLLLTRPPRGDVGG